MRYACLACGGIIEQPKGGGLLRSYTYCRVHQEEAALYRSKEMLSLATRLTYRKKKRKT
jgi:hypothetical protein